MKKALFLITALVLILTVCIVLGINKAKAEGPAKEIIGSWTQQSGNAGINTMIQFKDDGTGICFTEEIGFVSNPENKGDFNKAKKEFTYSYDGANTITINGTDCFISIVDNGLILENPFVPAATWQNVFCRA